MPGLQPEEFLPTDHKRTAREVAMLGDPELSDRDPAAFDERVSAYFGLLRELGGEVVGAVNEQAVVTADVAEPLEGDVAPSSRVEVVEEVQKPSIRLRQSHSGRRESPAEAYLRESREAYEKTHPEIARERTRRDEEAWSEIVHRHASS